MCGHDYDHIDLDRIAEPRRSKMSSKVIITKHDGTVVEHDAQAFQSTGTVYVIEDVDGVSHIERAADVKTITTELQEELKGQI